MIPSASTMLFEYFQILEREALQAKPIEEVKALWDEYDGCNSPGGFSGENIHLVLNLRGEGHYCAV
jgi:hypothetical protein